jgi:hypothetical protein
MRAQRLLSAALLALGVAVFGVALTGSEASRLGAAPPKGGIFRVVFAPPEPLDTMDPAIANTQASWAIA